MDEKTKEALEGSIKKWEEIVKEDSFDNGSANCPLCQEFVKSYPHCSKCPVCLETGRTSCVDSPYEIWEAHHDKAHNIWSVPFDNHEDCEECTKLAQAELNFLISLREDSK